MEKAEKAQDTTDARNAIMQISLDLFTLEKRAMAARALREMLSGAARTAKETSLICGEIGLTDKLAVFLGKSYDGLETQCNVAWTLLNITFHSDKKAIADNEEFCTDLFRHIFSDFARLRSLCIGVAQNLLGNARFAKRCITNDFVTRLVAVATKHINDKTRSEEIDDCVMCLGAMCSCQLTDKEANYLSQAIPMFQRVLTECGHGNNISTILEAIARIAKYEKFVYNKIVPTVFPIFVCRSCLDYSSKRMIAHVVNIITQASQWYRFPWNGFKSPALLNFFARILSNQNYNKFVEKTIWSMANIVASGPGALNYVMSHDTLHKSILEVARTTKDQETANTALWYMIECVRSARNDVHLMSTLMESGAIDAIVTALLHPDKAIRDSACPALEAILGFPEINFVEDFKPHYDKLTANLKIAASQYGVIDAIKVLARISFLANEERPRNCKCLLCNESSTGTGYVRCGPYECCAKCAAVIPCTTQTIKTESARRLHRY
jgi:hypothetical protein